MDRTDGLRTQPTTIASAYFTSATIISPSVVSALESHGAQIQVHHDVQVSVDSHGETTHEPIAVQSSLHVPTCACFQSNIERQPAKFTSISTSICAEVNMQRAGRTISLFPIQHLEDMLRELDTDIDALSISDTQSIRSTSTYGIGTVGGRVLMALGETALSGINQGNVLRKLRSAWLSLRNTNEVPTSTYATLLELQRRGLYSDSVRQSAWILLLRGMETRRVSGLVEALTYWPFIEISAFLRYLNICKGSQWSLSPIYESKPQLVVSLPRIWSTTSMNRSYSYILVRLLGHLVKASRSIRDTTYDTEAQWLLSLLMDEMIFWGREEFLTELRLLVEDSSQDDRAVLLALFMYFDPFAESSDYGIIPRALNARGEQRIVTEWTHRAISYIIRKVFREAITTGKLVPPLGKLLHFTTVAELQRWTEEMELRVLEDFVYRLDSGDEAIFQQITQDPEARLVKQLQYDLQSYQMTVSTSPTDARLAALAKASVIIRLRVYIAKMLWVPEKRTECSLMLMTVLLKICQIDRDRTDIAMVAWDFIFLELLAGFPLPIAESLRQLSPEQIVTVLGDLVHMVWNTHSPYTRSVLAAAEVDKSWSSVRTRMKQSVNAIIANLSEDYDVVVFGADVGDESAL